MSYLQRPAHQPAGAYFSPDHTGTQQYCPVSCRILNNMPTIVSLLQRLEASKSRFSAPVDTTAWSHESRVGCKPTP